METEALYEIIRNVTRIFAAILLLKYTVFLLAAPFHRVKESFRQLKIAKIYKMRSYKPLVSVLVPAWNEEVGIIGTVDSLIKNTYEHIEIIVVNDGSTDNTEKFIQAYVDEHKEVYKKQGKSIVYKYKTNGGKGKALNHAIEHAKGSILVTMDADSIADPQMIEKIVRYFADPKVDAVVGNVKVAGRLSFLNLLQRLEYLFGFYHKRAHSVLGAEYIYGGACAAFRRSTVFDQIGVFDTTNIAEDIELSMRTRFAGHYAVYADDAVCYTEGANTIVGLIKQRVRWKKGRFEAFFKYKKLFFSTRDKHNAWLSWFVLPLALLAEIQLLFEPIGLTLLVLYSIFTGDYSSVILGGIFVSIMYLVVGALTEKGRNWWIVPFAPFTWMIFYVLVWIEYLALLKSIGALIRSKEVAWQKWQRKGISGGTIKNTPAKKAS